MGVYFLRNFLFLRVNLLEPKAITSYCLFLWSAWTSTPLLSHRFGSFPNWQLLGPLLQLVVQLGPPGCQRQPSPLCNLLPGISQVSVAGHVGLGLCPREEVIQVTTQEHLCRGQAFILVRGVPASLMTLYRSLCLLVCIGEPH